jgi:hypothetical protein
LDIVNIDTERHEIFVYVNRDGQNFDLEAKLSTEPTSYPQAIFAADLNHDHHLDIIVTNAGTGNVGIFFGHGNGHFDNQMTISMPAGIHPITMAIADIDEDGHQDLVIASYGDENLRVLFGFGNRSFRIPEPIYIGMDSNLNSPVIADFNHDGHRDLAVARTWNHSISVLLGYGNGSFRQPTVYATGERGFPSLITVVDLNNDSYPDLVIMNSGTSNVVIMFGNENGIFRVAATISGNIYNPVSVALGDLDGDGYKELLVAECADTRVCVFSVDANGSLTNKNIKLNVPLSHAIWIAVAHVNEDHRLDIIVEDKNQLMVLYNTCDCCPT